MNLQYNLTTSNNLTQPESWNRTLCKFLKLTYSLFLMIYAGLQKWFNLAGMKEAIDLCKRILNGEHLTEFDEFDPVEEPQIVSNIAFIREHIPLFLGKIKPAKKNLQGEKESNPYFSFLKILDWLNQLEKYKKLLQHPVYFNEYKDKYNNTYIQAKAFIKDKYNKKKWYSAYVGPKPENSKKNEFDPETIKKGRILIRKKLVDFYK